MSQTPRPDREREPGFYWTRHTRGDGQWNTRIGHRQPEGPPGADLAALRRGLGREPGSVPGMWPFYICLNDEGRLTRRYRAEHAALTLFALHQQSQVRPMHRSGLGVGAAMLALRRHGTTRPDDTATGGDARTGTAAAGSGGGPTGTGGTPAEVEVDWSRIDPVDRRFTAAATATDLTELVAHLRGLVTQLRGIAQPLDYTALFDDLCRWQTPDGADRVRRRWGMQYFTRTRVVSDPTPEDAPTTDTEELS